MIDPVETIAEQWRELLPGIDASPLLVVGRVQRLTARWDGLLRAPFAAAGLASGDFDVLAALRRGDRALTPTELAEAMLVTAGAVTKRVDRLLAADLVSRSRSTHDGRGRIVELTAKGRRLTDRLIGEHLTNEAKLLSPLDDEEQQLLATLLSRLVTATEPSPSEARSTT